MKSDPDPRFPYADRMWDHFLVPFRRDGHVTFAVRVRPQAVRTEATEILADGSVKVSVAASPQDGEANEALVHYLAQVFAVDPARVAIRSGQSSRRKLITVRS